MGVYVKGMKMPESCEMCPIEGCEYINGKFTCPLIEIGEEAIDIAQDIMDGCKRFKERRADEHTDKRD